jgi:hypothetical protein
VVTHGCEKSSTFCGIPRGGLRSAHPARAGLRPVLAGRARSAAACVSSPGGLRPPSDQYYITFKNSFNFEWEPAGWHPLRSPSPLDRLASLAGLAARARSAPACVGPPGGLRPPSWRFWFKLKIFFFDFSLKTFFSKVRLLVQVELRIWQKPQNRLIKASLRPQQQKNSF